MTPSPGRSRQELLAALMHLREEAEAILARIAGAEKALGLEPGERIVLESREPVKVEGGTDG